MTDDGGVLGFLHIGVGVLAIGLSIPLLLGKVRMNRWYGARLHAAFASEAHWYRINRYGAVQMITYGVALGLLGVVVLLNPPRPGSLWFVMAAAAPGVLVIPMLVMLLRYAKRLSR
jgi:SdpI/YhfL family protein